jgi:hypothetical protein
MIDNPQVQIGCVANLFSRQMHFIKKGDLENEHAHVFDHLTLLAKGSLKVIVDGVESVFHAPKMIYIRANKRHKLVALEDDTVAYCIHALRDGDGVGDIIDPTSIPADASALSYAKEMVVQTVVPVNTFTAGL